MPLTLASTYLNDDDFLRAMEKCELPLSCFRHGDHLRLAWLYLHTQPFDEALCSIRNAIQRFAASHGVAHIYHETFTTAWVKLLSTHTEATFAEFILLNEDRLNQALLHQFWTPMCLASEAARCTWVPPDRSALPT